MRSSLATSRSHGHGRRRAPSRPTSSGRPSRAGGQAGAGSEGADKGEQAPTRPAAKVPELLAALEETYKQLDIRLTYEAIGGELGSGGLCKVKGQWRAIFDKRTTPSERVGLLAPILLRFPLEGVTLAEPVRELLERMRPPSASAEPEKAETSAELGTESNEKSDEGAAAAELEVVDKAESADAEFADADAAVPE